MRNSIACLLLCCFSLSQVLGQHIQRKGSLGIGYNQQNAIVQFVVPNSSAASMGVLPNDIITKVNDIVIKQPPQIMAMAKNLRSGEPLTLTILRNKKEMVLKGHVIPKPYETSSTADIEYGEFAYGEGYVRTIYKKPKGKMPLGTIYFLQGLPCYSMDNFQELDKTKQAIDAMVNEGFAVYRMEKADMGDNLHMPPCETMGFTAELAMYMAGYSNLLTLPGVDTSKIFLFGHSMGGVTAPMLSEKFQPRGVVVYGTVFKPWMDYLFDAYYYQLQQFGYDAAVLRDTMESIKPYIYSYFYTDKTADEICQDPKGREAMEILLGYNMHTKLAASGRSPLCHKELNQQNQARGWRNTKGYVLAIYGECDIAAIHADDHQALINYVNHIHPGRGEFWQAPASTHTFEEIGTMDEFIKLQADPAAYNQLAAKRFNAKIFTYTCNWMKKVLATPAL